MTHGEYELSGGQSAGCENVVDDPSVYSSSAVLVGMDVNQSECRYCSDHYGIHAPSQRTIDEVHEPGHERIKVSWTSVNVIGNRSTCFAVMESYESVFRSQP